MGILSEQNILGNPSLGEVSRPGIDRIGSVADYAFAGVWRTSMATGVLKSLATFMAPSEYELDKQMGTVTKSMPSATEGVNGEEINTSDGTYGGAENGNQLADSEQTNLGAVAEVLAGNDEPVESTTTLSSETQLESMRNKTVTPGTGVAVASGGDAGGYSANHIYQDVNKSDWQGDMALATAAAADASDVGMGHGSQASETKKSGPPLSGEGSMESFQEAMQSGGETTPPAQVENPMYALMGMDPPGVGTGPPAAVSASDPRMEEFASSSQSAPKDPRAEFYR